MGQLQLVWRYGLRVSGGIETWLLMRLYLQP
jgi:hypothetical protein